MRDFPSTRTPLKSVPPAFALIACDVFTEEMDALYPVNKPWRLSVLLEMGLHDDPDRLRDSVQAAIASAEADPAIEAIALAYGRCGNGLVGLRAGRCPLVLPQAHDCISILLGGPERHASVLRENPGTYFYSPGWVCGRRVPGPDRERYLRELYGRRYGDDEEMLEELIDADREAYAHHNCAAYVSIIDRPDTERYCKGCAAHLDWEYRKLEGDPSFLRALFSGAWDGPRFLRVPPGYEIAANAEGRLIAITAA